MQVTLVSLCPTDAAKLYFIDGLSDPRDARLRYVGITRQSAQKRLNSHLKAARRGAQLHSSRWLRRLLAAKVLEIESHRPLKWRCACSCGQIAVIPAHSFSARLVKSCGCSSRELAAQRTRSRARHGMWQSKEYFTWKEMRARCNNPNHARYACNGALGVRVCPVWDAAFEPFLRDMGPRPENLVLMRKNGKQDYSPENCVWATRSQLRKQPR